MGTRKGVYVCFAGACRETLPRDCTSTPRRDTGLTAWQPSAVESLDRGVGLNFLSCSSAWLLWSLCRLGTPLSMSAGAWCSGMIFEATTSWLKRGPAECSPRQSSPVPWVGATLREAATGANEQASASGTELEADAPVPGLMQSTSRSQNARAAKAFGGCPGMRSLDWSSGSLAGAWPPKMPQPFCPSDRLARPCLGQGSGTAWASGARS